MIAVKRLILYSLVGVEVLIIAYCSVYNEHGIRAIMSLHKENQVLIQEINNITQEVSALTNEIDDWNKYPFFKEKYARDYLQMGHPNDEIYLM